MNSPRAEIVFWCGRTYEDALLGNWAHTHALLNASDYRRKVKEYMTIHDTSEQAVMQRYGDSSARYRFRHNAEVMADWLKHDVDRRLGDDHAFPIFMVDSINANVPVICYNRSAIEANSYAILWPLQYHVDVARKGLGDQRRFLEKQPKIVFRGALSSPLKSKMLPGGYVKVSRPEFLQNLLHHPDIADVGIHLIPPHVRASPEYAPMQEAISLLLKPEIPFDRMLEYRYILCIEGADISSGFGAVLASNSIPIHPFPFCYNVWYFNGLVPWEHFVPVAPDGSNMRAVFEYCESHPEEMRYISESGRAHMQRMLDDELLSAVKRGVVKLWNLKRS
ncbi:MAG TPA: glycosyl transferase family 90 [Xanthobacteraceae bacterium]